MLSSMLSSRLISGPLPLHQACFSALTSLLAFHATNREDSTNCSQSQLAGGSPNRLLAGAPPAQTPARAQLQRRAAAWQQPWQLQHQRCGLGCGPCSIASAAVPAAATCWTTYMPPRCRRLLLCSRHLAGSKAEDFDLISVEVGIARIDG